MTSPRRPLLGRPKTIPAATTHPTRADDTNEPAPPKPVIFPQGRLIAAAKRASNELRIAVAAIDSMELRNAPRPEVLAEPVLAYTQEAAVEPALAPARSIERKAPLIRQAGPALRARKPSASPQAQAPESPGVESTTELAPDQSLADELPTLLTVELPIMVVQPAAATEAPTPPAEPMPEAFRQVFDHIAQYGSIGEEDLASRFGGARFARRFAGEYERFQHSLPFKITIDTSNGAKRYVKHG